MTLLRRALVEKRPLVLLVVAVVAVDAALYALVISSSRARAVAERRAERAESGHDEARQGLAAAEAARAGTTTAAAAVDSFYRDALVMEQRVTVSDRVEEGRLGRLRMTMRLEGDYRNLRRFVYALETGAEFIVIEEIALRDGDRDDSVQVLTIGLAIYFEAEPEAALGDD